MYAPREHKQTARLSREVSSGHGNSIQEREIPNKNQAEVMIKMKTIIDQIKVQRIASPTERIT